jgi:hypothetical protein
MKLTCLTEHDFIEVAKTTALRTDAWAMARAVLVERRSLADVASQYQVSRQRVHLAVEVIRKAYDKEQLRSGWMGVDIELPHPLAADVTRVAKLLWDKPDSERRQKALALLSRALGDAERELLKLT